METAMLPELKKEDVDNKMTWREVIRYYWPGKTNDECEYILWNETCYPFSDEVTCHQIYNLYTQTYNTK